MKTWITVAAIAAGAAVTIWAVVAKPWKKGEKKNNEETADAPAEPEKPVEQPEKVAEPAKPVDQEKPNKEDNKEA